MSHQLNGELVPVGGGDAIPLIRELLTVGRRESCDICLHFPNISGLHCELSFRNGYWYIRDRNSTNGIKVNGSRVQEKVLNPKDEVTIGKRRYTIEYELPAGARPVESPEEDIMSQSLMEKAGLERPKRDKERGRPSKPSKDIDPADFLLGDDE
jgi:adenylate cyclase